MKPVLITVFVLAAFGAGYYLANPSSCGAACDIQLSSVAPETFNQHIQSGSATLLDIRTADEFAAGYIAGAQNINFNNSPQFAQFLKTLDKNKPYLIYCRTGSRSGQALRQMKAAGFTQVTELSGGIVAWQQANLPLAK